MSLLQRENDAIKSDEQQRSRRERTGCMHDPLSHAFWLAVPGTQFIHRLKQSQVRNSRRRLRVNLNWRNFNYLWLGINSHWHLHVEYCTAQELRARRAPCCSATLSTVRLIRQSKSSKGSRTLSGIAPLSDSALRTSTSLRRLSPVMTTA